MKPPLTIHRPHRPTIKATQQEDGTVIVHAGRSWLQFGPEDLHELYAYAIGQPTIQRYPANATDRTLKR